MTAEQTNKRSERSVVRGGEKYLYSPLRPHSSAHRHRTSTFHPAAAWRAARGLLRAVQVTRQITAALTPKSVHITAQNNSSSRDDRVYAVLVTTKMHMLLFPAFSEYSSVILTATSEYNWSNASATGTSKAATIYLQYTIRSTVR